MAGRSETSETKRTRPERRFRFLPGDLVIILVIVVFCAVFLAGVFLKGRSDAKKERLVRITQDGQVILEAKMERFSDPAEYTIVGESGSIVIYISSEEVYVKESPCEDQICVKAGVLRKVGDGAVCLPNRLVVQIVGGETESGEVDAVAK